MSLLDSVASALDGLGAGWFSAKTAFEHAIGFSNDALHVLAGVALQLLAAAVLRVPIGRWSPWLIVLGLELLNEWSDLHAERWPLNERSAQLGEGMKDVLLTMALPTLLLFAVRWFPAIFRKP